MTTTLLEWATEWVESLVREGGAHGPGSRRTIQITGDTWSSLFNPDDIAEQRAGLLIPAQPPHRKSGRYAVTFEETWNGADALWIDAVQYRDGVPDQRVLVALPFRRGFMGRSRALGPPVDVPVPAVDVPAPAVAPQARHIPQSAPAPRAQAPTKWPEIFPPLAMLKFDEQHSSATITTRTGPVNGVGNPRPADGEVVLGRWILREACLSVEFDMGEAHPDPIPGHARPLTGGDIAVLLTPTTLRGVFVRGESTFLGTFRAGWSPGSAVRTVQFAWPLDTIDVVELQPSERAPKAMVIETVHPRATLYVGDAAVAQESFLVKGLGIANKLPDFAWALLDATIKAQATSSDPDRRRHAHTVSGGGNRITDQWSTNLWFRDPTRRT